MFLTSVRSKHQIKKYIQKFLVVNSFTGELFSFFCPVLSLYNKQEPLLSSSMDRISLLDSDTSRDCGLVERKYFLSETSHKICILFVGLTDS